MGEPCPSYLDETGFHAADGRAWGELTVGRVETTNYGPECGPMCRNPDCVPCLRARVGVLERQLEAVTREHDRLRSSLLRARAAWNSASDEIGVALRV